MRVLIALVLALSCVATAAAYRGARPITTTQAEDALFASAWADANGIEDVQCSGLGNPVQAVGRGQATFTNFTCLPSYSDTDLYGLPETCSYSVTVHVLPPAGLRSTIKADNGLLIVGGKQVPNCQPDFQ